MISRQAQNSGKVNLPLLEILKLLKAEMTEKEAKFKETKISTNKIIINQCLTAQIKRQRDCRSREENPTIFPLKAFHMKHSA